jgi:uncharacterized SAM-binding protein YcdF (DUF218 family)
VDLLLSPLAWLVLAAATAVAAGWLPHPAWWRLLAVLVALAALAASTPWVANRLVGRLEREAPRHACAELPPTLVVLAGGVELRPRDPEDFSALNGASRRRMDAAITAWRRAPHTRLLLSGGASARHAPAIASLMAAYAHWAGVPAAAIDTEVSSLDTWQTRSPPG